MRSTLPALAVCALLAACVPKRAEVQPPPPERPLVLNEVRALTGDALLINGQHVRLANASTPERIPNARCWGEAVAGVAARARVTNMALAATDIEIVPTGGKDDYGRTYARVLLDGLDLGDDLYEVGLAVRPGKERFDWCGPTSMNVQQTPNVNALADLGR